jgi:hypothetical protein
MKPTPLTLAITAAAIALAAYAGTQFFSHPATAGKPAPVALPQSNDMHKITEEPASAPHAQKIQGGKIPADETVTPTSAPRGDESIVKRPSPQPASAPMAVASRDRTDAPPTASRSRSSDTQTPLTDQAQAQTVQPTQSSQIVYEVEPGVRAPAALIDDGKPLTPGQAKAIDLVGESFDANVAAATNSSASQSADPQVVWEAARKTADENFRLFFGDDAYNQKTLQAAQEALQK